MTAARIAVKRDGDCVRVTLYKGTSGTPERGALWKRSAFKAGDDDVLIASRAARRMAEKLVGPSFWIGQDNGPGCYLFNTVNFTPRLSFTVTPPMSNLERVTVGAYDRHFAPSAPKQPPYRITEAIAARAGHPTVAPANPKRAPAWAEFSPACHKGAGVCSGHGVYLGANRMGGRQWAAYKCDTCRAQWDRARF